LKKLSLLSFLALLAANVFGQNQSFSQLFYPNITLAASSYSPASYPTDGPAATYGNTRSQISGFMPIRSEVQVGLGFRKKLDLRAVHTVLGVHIAQNNTEYSPNNTAQNRYKSVALSLLQLKASVRDKLWLYGAGLGFSQAEESFFSPTPFIWGGAARMRALGLHKQILYGSAILYNQKLRITPVFGANVKFAKHWRLVGLLPFQASVSRQVGNFFNLELYSKLAGYSAGYQQVINFEKTPRRENLRQVNLGLSANVHALKVFSLSLSGGYMLQRQLKTFNAAQEPLGTLKPEPSPYVGVSVRYLTSKSNFSSKFLNKVGIGL
jgi:hypothetical protein